MAVLSFPRGRAGSSAGNRRTGMVINPGITEALRSNSCSRRKKETNSADFFLLKSTVAQGRAS